MFWLLLILPFALGQLYKVRNCSAGAPGIGSWTGTDPDLPCPPVNLVQIKTCSYIIPLDIAHQKTTSGSYNFRAYGLAANLLHSDIPLMWAIRTGKTHPDDVDFSALVRKIAPTSDSTVRNESFRSSAFIIDSSYTGSADGVITRFGGNVAVYATTQVFTADIRYNINFKPFIGVLNSGSKYDIQTSYLALAGFTQDQPGLRGQYRVMSKDEANSVSGNVCVTACTEPHFHAASDGQYDPWTYSFAMRNFTSSGGNFLAQCAGIATYEVCDVDTGRTAPGVDTAATPPHNCTGFFLTDKGLSIKSGEFSNGNDNFIYLPHADMAFYQMESYSKYSGGSPLVWKSIGGSVSVFGLYPAANPIAKLRAQSYWGVEDNSVTPSRKYSAATKLSQFLGYAGSGGNVFYLAGHDYGSTPVAVRLYLNAMFIPSNRPQNCNFNIDLASNQNSTAVCGCGQLADICGVCGGSNLCVPACVNVTSTSLPANGSIDAGLYCGAGDGRCGSTGGVPNVGDYVLVTLQFEPYWSASKLQGVYMDVGINDPAFGIIWTVTVPNYIFGGQLWTWEFNRALPFGGPIRYNLDTEYCVRWRPYYPDPGGFTVVWPDCPAHCFRTVSNSSDASSGGSPTVSNSATASSGGSPASSTAATGTAANSASQASASSTTQTSGQGGPGSGSVSDSSNGLSAVSTGSVSGDSSVGSNAGSLAGSSSVASGNGGIASSTSANGGSGAFSATAGQGGATQSGTQSGQTVIGSACSTHTDCGIGYACVSNTCQQATTGGQGWPCTSEANCLNTLSCSNGSCTETVGGEGWPCDASTDCLNGFSCVGSACQADQVGDSRVPRPW